MNTKEKARQIWRKAQIHRKSCEIGRPIPSQSFQLCECCDQIIFTQPISVCQPSKEFFMFGSGYPLWFSFLKHCMLLVFVLIISKTATEIYIATQENYQFCYGAKDVIKHPLKEGLIPLIEDSSMRLNHNFQEKTHLQSHRIPLTLHNEQTNSPKGFPPASHRNQQSTINPTGQRQCTSILVYLSYFKQQKLIKDWFLTLIQFIAHLVALVYFRNTIMKQQQRYNEKACLISDYTLVVKNLPHTKGLKQGIINLFANNFHKSCNIINAEIQQIILIFQDPQIKTLDQDSIRIQHQFIKAENQDDKQMIQKKTLELKEIKEKIDIRIRQVRQLIDRDQIICEKALVTLRTQLDRIQVLQKYKQDLKDDISYNKYFKTSIQKSRKIHDHIFSGQIILVAAHQPNEIIWDNIDVMETTRRFRILIGWIITAVILVIVTLIYYFIIKGKSKIVLKALSSQYQNSSIPTILKSIASIFIILVFIGIVLFNKFVLQKALRHIVNEQKHAYKDKQNLSFAVKYALAMFFTTALMTLIVEAFMYKNYYSHHLGLIQEQSLFFFIVALFIPLVLWIEPYDLYKNWKRSKVFGTLMRQEEANLMMEDYHYDMSKRYSQIFKLMWFTFLYAELIPLGSFLTLGGLFFYYWVDKNNFVKSCTRKPGISGKMSLFAVKSIEATLFLVPAGQFLFDLMLTHNFNVLSLVLMILGIVYLVLPIGSLIWTLNDEKFQLQSKTYPQAVAQFRQTYLSMHPVYSKTHFKQIQLHRQRVKEYYRNEIRKEKIYKIQKGTYFRQQPGQRKLIMVSD